ncbi:MAG: hypothetical protein ACJAU2_000355 [Maribacter sp.]|jgi:hypothetical protein
MSRIAGYILKNKETNRVFFVIVGKAQITISLRINGVTNVSLAMKEYLCEAALLWRVPNYPL